MQLIDANEVTWFMIWASPGIKVQYASLNKLSQIKGDESLEDKFLWLFI
jgi:hypothetical protein